MEFAASYELMPDGLPFVTHRYFAGQALLITSHSRSRTEYLLPTDNVTVFH